MGQHVSHLEIDPRLTHLEDWSIDRVCFLIELRDPHGSLDTGALTKEDLFKLLRFDDRTISKNSKNSQLMKLNGRNDNCDSDDDSEIFLEEEIAVYERFAQVASAQITQLQAAARGFIYRSLIRREKAAKIEDKKRVISLFLDKSGTNKLEQIFQFFCRNGDSVNHFDGQNTIDVLDVIITLILLCVGTARAKLGKLFDLFALENPSNLNKEELNLLLIVCSKALMNMTGASINITNLEHLEYKPNNNQVFEREEFLYWCMQTPKIAQWTGKLCYDVRFFIIELGGKLWHLVAKRNSSEFLGCGRDRDPGHENNEDGLGFICAHTNVSDSNSLDNSSDWIGVFPTGVKCDEYKVEANMNNPFSTALDFQKYNENPEKCFILPPDSFHSAVALRRVIKRGDGVFTVKDTSQIIFLGLPYVSFLPIQNDQVLYGKPCNFSFENAKYIDGDVRWCRDDWIGLYEASIPMGIKGYFSRVFIFKGSYEKKRAKFESTHIPGLGHRALIYGKAKDNYCWVNFQSQETFYALLASDEKNNGTSTPKKTQKILPGCKVVARLSEKCNCYEEGELCECPWIPATVIQVLEDGHVFLDRSEENRNRRNTNVKSIFSTRRNQTSGRRNAITSHDTITVQKSSIRILYQGSRNLDPPGNYTIVLFEDTISKHSTYKRIYRCGQTTYSGKFELRYISAKSGNAVITYSNSFPICPNAIYFHEFEGGNIDEDIICKFHENERGRNGVGVLPDSFIGMYPYDWPQSLKPWKDDMCVLIRNRLKPKFESEESVAIFEAYHYPKDVGGIFEFRFVQPSLQRIECVSNAEYLLPIFRFLNTPEKVLRKRSINESTNRKAQAVVCNFQIICPEIVWSEWDVIQLIHVQQNEIDPEYDEIGSDTSADESSINSTKRVIETVVTWRYVTIKQKNQGWVSITLDDTIPNGILKWKYCGVMQKLRAMESKSFEVYEDVLVHIATQDEINYNNAILLQRYTRSFLARQILKQRIQTLKDKSQGLVNELEWARNDYEKISKANARRNQMLLGKKDRDKETAALELISTIEAEIREMKGIKLDVVNRENSRIAEIRQMTREEGEKKEYDKAINDESERRKKLRKQLYVKTSSVVTNWNVFDNGYTSDVEVIDIATWCKDTQRVYEDEEFPAVDVSLYGSDSLGENTTLETGYSRKILKNSTIEWMRPSSFADKKSGVILFTNPMRLDDIGVSHQADSRVEGYFDVFYLSLRLCMEYHSQNSLPFIIDTRYSEFGVYAVQIYLNGEKETIVIDDKFPCYFGYDKDVRSEYQKRRIKKQWFPAFGGIKTGLWTLILEKAWAKIHGSYDMAISQNISYSVQEVLSVFLGGFAMTYHPPRWTSHLSRGEQPFVYEPAAEMINDHLSLFNFPFQNKVILSRLYPGYNLGDDKHLLSLLQYQSELSKCNDSETFIDKVHIIGIFSGFHLQVTQFLDRTLTFEMDPELDEPTERKEPKENTREPMKVEKKIILLQLRPSYHLYQNGQTWKWEGDWSNNSGLWTKEAKTLFGFDEIDDGTFWISLEDFLRHVDTWGCSMNKRNRSSTPLRKLDVIWDQTKQNTYSTGLKVVNKNTFSSHIGLNQGWRIKTFGNEMIISLNVKSQESPETRLLVLERCESNTIQKVHGVGVVGNGIRHHSLKISGVDEIMIVPVLWHSGLESSCCIRLWALNDSKTIDDPLTEFNLFCERVDFSDAATLRKFGIHSNDQNMGLVKKPEKANIPDAFHCAGCLTFIKPVEREASFCFRGMMWHYGCFGCTYCMTSYHPHLYLRKFNELYEEEDLCIHFPLFPVAAVHYSIGERRFKLLCTPCWKSNLAPACEDCGSAIELTGICQLCDQQKRIDEAPKCFACNEAMIKIIGKFSGVTVRVDDVTIHSECQRLYKELKAPKCAHCEGPLMKVPNKFSGKIKKTKPGYIHLECYNLILENKKTARKG